MTKAMMMKEAHKLAKTFEGDYTACLALALRTLNRKEEEVMNKMNEKQFLEEYKRLGINEVMQKGKIITVRENGANTFLAIENFVEAINDYEYYFFNINFEDRKEMKNYAKEQLEKLGL